MRKEGERASQDRVGRNNRLGRGKRWGWREGKRERGREVRAGERRGRVRRKQLFQVLFGRTLAIFQNGRNLVPFLPFVAFDALLVFALLLALLAFLAFFAFASHVSAGETVALAFPCIRAFAFTGWRGRSLIRVCPNGRPVGRSAKGRKMPVDVPGGRLARVGRRNGPWRGTFWRSGGRSLWRRSFRSLTSCRGRLIELQWSRRVKSEAFWQGDDVWSSRSRGSLGPAGERLCVAPPCECGTGRACCWQLCHRGFSVFDELDNLRWRDIAAEEGKETAWDRGFIPLHHVGQTWKYIWERSQWMMCSSGGEGLTLRQMGPKIPS